MKKSIAVGTAVAAMLASASLVAVSSPAEAAVGIHVSGGRLYEANGSELVLRGVSHAHTWYPTQTSSYASIGALGANSVRTVLSGGRWTPNSASDVANVISLAKQAKLISVLEDHDTTGYGEQSGAYTLDQAVDYWISIKSALDGQENYVILNIGNEPIGNNNYTGWGTDTANAIKRLRAAGFQHTIMVDAPNWGQDWSGTMKAQAAQVYAADTTGNTVFSIHMYGVYDTAAEVTSYIDTFLNAGLPIVVGEFGNMHSDGDPDEDTIMAYTTTKKVGYLGWSWSGNGGGVEYLDMVTSFNASALTSWGTRIFDGANGIKATSKVATIFSGTNPTTTTTTRPVTTTTTTTRPVTTTTTASGAPTKIMALGDSITGSPGCWRALLWQKLVAAGYTNIDFVGTLAGQGCGFTYDGENEGHGGYLVTNVASSGDFANWMSQTKPDVILMHFGTNDVWSNIAPATILSAYSTIVSQARAVNPNVKFLVAQIIPVAPSTCAECPQRTIDLNAAIPGWASGISTAASPVTVVDQWTGWVPATDTTDGVHPSDPAGITKMSNKWYPAVAAVLGGTTPTTTTTTRPVTTTTTTTTTRPVTTTTTTTTTRPTTTTTTTSVPGSAAVTWTVENSWGGGLQATVKVTNTGTSTINGWTVGATLPAGQTIQQVYNGSFTQSGQQVTITNAGYNGTIAPGASASTGMSVAWTTNNGPATNLTLNGVPVGGTTTTTTPVTTTTTTRPTTTTTTTVPTTTTTTTRPTTTTTTTVPTTTTTTRPVTTTTTTTTTTGTGGKTCTAVISAIGAWSGGWQGEVKVTAGSSAIAGWTVTWTFPNGALSSAWNATVSGTTTVTGTDVGWNGTLAAGASGSWGFIASGTPSIPTVTCTAK